MAPSPYWGDEAIWDSQTSTHNPMFDEKGRVWFTSRVCVRRQSGLLQARARTIRRPRCSRSTRRPASSRCTIPKTGKFTLIDTCFPTHHLMFAEDANNTLWLSSGGAGRGVVGWLNTQDVRGDRRRSEVAGLDAVRPRHQRQRQARRLRRAEPAGRSDQGQAHRRRASTRRRQSAATARSGARSLTFPATSSGSIRAPIRRRPRSPEIYEPPAPGYGAARHRHRPQRRGLGAARERPSRRASTAASARSAERPDRDRQALPRRLDALSVPRPAASRASTETGSAEASYYTWVDQFDTVRARRERADRDRQPERRRCWRWSDGKLVNLRVPYPMGFYAKWMDGRIDDPNAGWKGRGLWATYGDRAPVPHRRRQGHRPKVVKFQLRPDPLAK